MLRTNLELEKKNDTKLVVNNGQRKHEIIKT